MCAQILSKEISKQLHVAGVWCRKTAPSESQLISFRFSSGWQRKERETMKMYTDNRLKRSELKETS